MNKISLIISIVLHAFIIAMAYINFSGIFSTKIKDRGYVVFDYVNVGERSKAPILSDLEGKLSKTKSHIDEKSSNLNINKQPLEGSKASQKHNEQELNKATDNKKPKDTNLKINQKKDTKPKHTHTKGKDKKNSTDAKEKAIVNLRKNKMNTKKDLSSVKKSFNSLLDGALADGEHENSGIKAEEVGETLTATQVDLIRQTIKKCWHFPAGLKNAEDLVVDIKMELDTSGNVTKAEIVDKARMEHDADFKIAAENAYRAVLDPNCNPLPLPKEKYKEWKELELSFNPKDMFS